MHNLINAAPQFDGSEDVEFWVNEIDEYLDRCEVSNEKVCKNVLIGALQGAAREWFGSLTSSECDKGDLMSVRKAIIDRFSKTYMQKLRAYETIKQKP
jgi:hypothetical protein